MIDSNRLCIVIASVAKQSIDQARLPMDCFVAEFIIGPAGGRTRWLLAMTGKDDNEMQGLRI